MNKFVGICIIQALFIATSAFSIDENPGFETQDLSGSTVNYQNTVGTSPINVPTVADKVISEVFFKCSVQTPATTRCFISFDNTTYLTLLPGEAIGWSVKGNKKQIRIKGSGAGVLWEAVINYENF
jgi:hypothetical protein